MDKIPSVIRPSFVEPMAAKLVDELPEGKGWVYEIKLDGYRVLALKDGGSVRLLSRNDKDLTREFSHIASAMAKLPAESCTLDGEVVAVDEQGVPRFQMLQHRSRTPRSRITYYAFDLLNEGGQDLRKLPLSGRKQRLAALVKGSGVMLSDSLPGPSGKLVEAARAMKLEGVIAKKLDSRYEAGQRTGAWQKLRLNVSQEFVVGGYSPMGNPFDGLLVGYYEGDKLMFCAQVRGGFSPANKRELWARLRGTEISSHPFANLPMGRSGGWNEGLATEDMKKMKWVKPETVVQIAFVEWTDYHLLRHSSYVGMRDDKDPRDVVREAT